MIHVPHSVFRSCAALAGAMFLVVAQPVSAQTANPQASVLVRLLADRQVLSADAVAAIRAASLWRAAGQSAVVVYEDRVVAGTPLADQAAGDKSVADMQARMTPQGAAQRAPAGTSTEDAVRLGDMRAALSRMPDDGSTRLTLQREAAVFLVPGVKLSTIEERYGKPQKITTELVEAQGERRPTVLTIYEYDDGAVRFAASDMSPTPGTVDRVFIDLGAVERLTSGS